MDLTSTYLVTHKACADGSSCAVLFVAAGGKKENIYFTNPSHNFTDEIVKDLMDRGDGPVLIVDVSISLALAEQYNSRGGTGIYLLDHHASSIPLSKFLFCNVDQKNSRCGSKMLYDYIRTDVAAFGNEAGVDLSKLVKYRDLIRLVDDQDRWIHNYPESKDMSSLHKVLGQEMFVDRFIKRPEAESTIQEQYLIDIYNKKREQNTKTRKQNTRVFTKTVQGHDIRIGIVVSYGDDQSWLGNAMCSDPAVDVDVAIIINGEGVSLRASQDCPVDVAKIAGLNSGGGHKKASGCSLAGILGRDFVELIMDKMKFE